MDTAAPDTLIGQRIFGSYVVTRPIGAGGMGAVYLAENKSLGRALAVKVLLEERSHSPQAVARFIAEAKAASAIRHRNIIDVIDTSLLPDGRHYMLMEYLEGSTLRKFARDRFPLTLDIVLSVLGQVCAGLQAAHDRGIIHRDLKPSNIIISPQPDNPYLTKILDFGIAKLAAPDLTSDAHTKSRTVAGTPYYMSPEQARALRDVDHRTDIYALGVIAYEIITGRPPYAAASAGDLVYQQQTTTPIAPIERVPALPESWNQLILDAIHLDPERRPQSAREMAERMIANTDRGIEIAKATAPLLFTASVSQPITGESSQPLIPEDLVGVRPAPTEDSAPARPAATMPPARPAGTVAPAPVRAQGSGTPQTSIPISLATFEGADAAGATRDLRSGSHASRTGPPTQPRASQMPSAVVPTTLGLSASEIPVFEGTMLASGERRRTRWLVGGGIAAGLFIAGATVAMWSAGRQVRPAREAPPQLPAPVATPIVEDGPERAVDAAPAAANVPAHGPVDAGMTGPVDAASSLQQDTASDRKTTKSSRSKGVDAAPLTDDELFDTRK